MPDYRGDLNANWCQEIASYEKLWSNVIFFNWTKFHLNTYEETASQHNMLYTAKALKNFIIKRTEGQDVEQLRIVAHGLSAHFVGVAARMLKRNLKVNEIIALDPTGYPFEDDHRPDRLSKDDATQVLVIHTNPGRYGFKDSLGDWDIYSTGLHFACTPVTFSIAEKNTTKLGEIERERITCQ